MAKQPKVQEVSFPVEAPTEGEQSTAPLELFPEEQLHVLKLGSVDVPVIEDGKGFWKNVTQKDWSLEHQRALFDYWKEQAAENSGFSIEAKKAKLFL